MVILKRSREVRVLIQRGLLVTSWPMPRKKERTIPEKIIIYCIFSIIMSKYNKSISSGNIFHGNI